jgi:hypothetical protein
MEAWIAQYFFNPAYVAGGAALIASPIIIHLINRMRFRRVRFAAMEFLLQSQQRNRRRVLLEQLLLLLLRILIVLVLVAIIARLVLDPSQMSVFRGVKAHHVVLLDDTVSMRNRWGDTNAFAEGLEVVKKLAAEGARRPNTQKLSLLLLTSPDQPLFVQRDVNDDFMRELVTKLDNVRCSHRTADLVGGLDAVANLFAEERGTVKHLHFISDFRASDWGPSNALAASVRALDSAGISVNLVKTVAERHANLAVTQLTGDMQVAATSVPVRLKVGVQNHSQQVARDVRLTVVQNGRQLPMSVTFEEIEAGIEATREFDVTFDAPGKHQIQVSLEDDALSEDNTRYLAIDIAGANPVLIIDGDPAGDEGQYLADALAADPGITGYAPIVESPDYLGRRPLDGYQSIFLLNVPELPADALQPLEDYVAGGGGLAWFLGDAVKSSYYNSQLYRDGDGLFPVPLAVAPQELSRDPISGSGPDIRFRSHPIFSVFEGEQNSYIDASNIYSYFAVADDWERDDQERGDNITTIASLRNRHPLMFEHTFGAGRIVTCLTSCGPMWNNLAQLPSFVVIQLELEKRIARTDRVLERRIVGEPIAVSLDPAEFTDLVEIAAPDAAGQRLTRLKAAPESDGNGAADDGAQAVAEPVRLIATFRETDLPGVYGVKLLDQNQVPHEKWIAYNVPIEEGDLELASTAQIRRQIGDDVLVGVQEPGSFQWLEGKDVGQEVREWLLMLLVGLLVAEQLLAYRLSYHPQVKPATA